MRRILRKKEKKYTAIHTGTGSIPDMREQNTTIKKQNKCYFIDYREGGKRERDTVDTVDTVDTGVYRSYTKIKKK